MTNYKTTVEQALQQLRQGRFVIVCDDEARENEGDLIAAAEQVTPELVNFAISEGRGLLCQAVDEQTASYLALPMMNPANSSVFATAFTVSVDHCEAGTGISAAARALTIRTIGEAAGEAREFTQEFCSGCHPSAVQLGKREAMRKKLLRPGHIFPLIAMPGGVLQRRGQTEATVDLMRLACLKPSGVLCELIGQNGQMLNGSELDNFAKQHNLCILRVQDIALYRRKILGHSWNEQQQFESRFGTVSLQMETQVELPCTQGFLYACAIEDARDIGAEHLLLWKGALEKQQNPLLRIHSECFTGEVLFSQRCDCRSQLDAALQRIEAEGQGLVIYLRQEGRGIGLRNKLRAYNVQQRHNIDTVEANAALGFADDLREYSVAVGVLRRLQVQKVRLMTNNPHKIRALEQAGIAVERIKIHVESSPHNRDYLVTKKNKSGHLL